MTFALVIYLGSIVAQNEYAKVYRGDFFPSEAGWIRPAFRGPKMEHVDASHSIRFSRVTRVRRDSQNYHGRYTMFPKQKSVRLTVANCTALSRTREI